MKDNALVEVLRGVMAGIISSGSGPAAPVFDEFDAAHEANRGSWYKVDGAAIDRARKVLDAGPVEVSDSDWGPVNALWLAFIHLHESNARHKRGFTLQGVPPVHSLLHAVGELTEAAQEVTAGGDRDQVVSELGDALGCLIHFLVAQGIGPAEVALSALSKLDRDFPGEGMSP